MARVARQMEAAAVKKAATDAADAPAARQPSDAFLPTTNVASPRLGDALLTISGTAGPIDPVYLLMAQQAYTGE